MAKAFMLIGKSSIYHKIKFKQLAALRQHLNQATIQFYIQEGLGFEGGKRDIFLNGFVIIMLVNYVIKILDT